MATKPLNAWAGKTGRSKSTRFPSDGASQFDAVKVNNNDQAAPGPIVQDGYGMSDPNAMGPNMRPVYDATACKASHWADQHDSNPEDVPYPRVQRGSVAEGSISARFRGRTGDDERFGPAGQFDPVDNPYAGVGNDDGDAGVAMPGKRVKGSI